MAINFDRTTLALDEVKLLGVSDIEEVPDTGGFIRVLTILTDTSGNMPVLEVRLTSMTKAKLEITTPPQEF